MNTTPDIAIIDDDAWKVKLYQEQLILRGFKVRVYSDSDEWRLLLTDPPGKVPHFFIVDVMMLDGNYYANEIHERRLFTGLLLGRDLRKRFRERPIVFLSNFDVPDLREKAQFISKQIGKSILVTKNSKTVDKLPQCVERYYKSGNLKKDMWERIKDSFIGAPNFSGIGIDLAKLFE